MVSGAVGSSSTPELRLKCFKVSLWFHCLTVWLFACVCSVLWPIGCSVVCLFSCPFVCSVGCLIVRLFCCCLIVGHMLVGLSGCLAKWLVGRRKVGTLNKGTNKTRDHEPSWANMAPLAKGMLRTPSFLFNVWGFIDAQWTQTILPGLWVSEILGIHHRPSPKID